MVEIYRPAVRRRAAVNFGVLVLPLVLALTVPAPPVAAQQAGVQQGFIDEIVVTADRTKTVGLNAAAGVGTNLGLTALETPASLDTVDLSSQTRLGFRSVAEATRGVTGLTFTTRSGAPGVFQSRGFTESLFGNSRVGVSA